MHMQFIQIWANPSQKMDGSPALRFLILPCLYHAFEYFYPLFSIAYDDDRSPYPDDAAVFFWGQGPGRGACFCRTTYYFRTLCSA